MVVGVWWEYVFRIFLANGWEIELATVTNLAFSKWRWKIDVLRSLSRHWGYRMVSSDIKNWVFWASDVAWLRSYGPGKWSISSRLSRRFFSLRLHHFSLQIDWISSWECCLSISWLECDCLRLKCGLIVHVLSELTCIAGFHDCYSLYFAILVVWSGSAQFWIIFECV